jgi:hypothetical protein
MRIPSMKLLWLVFFLAGTIFFMIAQDSSEERPYGMYSNMEISEETGDVSGFEFFLLPSNEGPFVVFQDAEGWPKKPLILKLTIGGYTTADNNVLRFSHPEMGPFVGKIEGERLIGTFSDMRYSIELTKGNSVWQ